MSKLQNSIGKKITINFVALKCKFEYLSVLIYLNVSAQSCSGQFLRAEESLGFDICTNAHMNF